MSANRAIKRIDIKEFREQGFLQEANRQFFHPHGLALEVTTVDGDGWDVDSARVIAAAERLSGPDGPYDTLEEAAHHVVVTLNALYPPGSMHLSGCWDYRDDPEGVIFGDGGEGKAAYAESVAAQREQHRATRHEMFGRGAMVCFGVPTDVEPIDWVYTEDGDVA